MGIADYDNSLFSPPAPVASVTLLNPASDLRISGVKMLVDTEADVSLVPHFILEELGIDLSSAREIELADFNDHRSKSLAIYLNLQFAGKVFRGQFPIVAQPYGILGRNLLNQLKVELDGPERVWRVL